MRRKLLGTEDDVVSKKEKDGYIPYIHEQTGNKSVVTNGSIILKQQVQVWDITVNRANLSYYYEIIEDVPEIIEKGIWIETHMV